MGLFKKDEFEMFFFLDKSEEDSDFGCRGVISLQKATIKVCHLKYLLLLVLLLLN